MSRPAGIYSPNFFSLQILACEETATTSRHYIVNSQHTQVQPVKKKMTMMKYDNNDDDDDKEEEEQDDKKRDEKGRTTLNRRNTKQTNRLKMTIVIPMR